MAQVTPEPSRSRGPASASTRRAYEALQDGIAAGELSAGSWLREPVVAARLGLSRTPVREALRMLAAEGAVELVHNRGARVVRWSAQDIDEVYRLRGLLEGQGAALAARHATAEQVDRVRDCQQRYEQALDEQALDEQALDEQALDEQALEQQALRGQGLDDQALSRQGPDGQAQSGQASGGQASAGQASGKGADSTRTAACNDDFHAAVMTAAGSPRLAALLGTISSAPLVARALRQYSEDDRQRSVLQHRDIVLALTRRDEDLAETAMRSHILAARYAAVRVADEPGAR